MSWGTVHIASINIRRQMYIKSARFYTGKIKKSFFFSEKAIIATIYRYTDKYFVYQNTMPSDDKQVCVIFESKDGALDENIAKQFCNDLIDQQLREITTEKCGHIRDLIVEEAFTLSNGTRYSGGRGSLSESWISSFRSLTSSKFI